MEDSEKTAEGTVSEDELNKQAWQTGRNPTHPKQS